MKFEWLVKELEWIDESSKFNKILNRYQFLTDFGFYTVILDKEGTCIAHPEEKTLTINDKDVLKRLATKKSGVADLKIDGKECTIFYGPIEYIDWAVAVIVPKQDILKPLLPTATLLLVMVVAGLLIVWFVCKRT
jgi:sensor histidine kinase YesM